MLRVTPNWHDDANNVLNYKPQKTNATNVRGHWQPSQKNMPNISQGNTHTQLHCKFTAESRARLSRGQAIGASLQKIWKSHSIPISTKIRLMKALLWNTSWGLWDERTEKDSACFVDSKENKWVGSQQSWSKEGTVRHRQSEEASILWSHHEETSELTGERNSARNNARCTQARKTTHVLDRQHQVVDRTLMEESIRMTEDRDKWRKYVHGVASPRIKDGWGTEQNKRNTFDYVFF